MSWAAARFGTGRPLPPCKIPATSSDAYIRGQLRDRRQCAQHIVQGLMLHPVDRVRCYMCGEKHKHKHGKYERNSLSIIPIQTCYFSDMFPGKACPLPSTRDLEPYFLAGARGGTEYSCSYVFCVPTSPTPHATSHCDGLNQRCSVNTRCA